MSDLQSLDSGEIYNPQAYASATKRYIVGNARKTWQRTYADWEQVYDFLFGKYDHETNKYIHKPKAVYEGYGSTYHIVEGTTFLSKMAYSLETYGKLTEGQTNAVRKIMAQQAERKAEWARKDAELNAARQHLGEIGKKIVLELTIKKVVEIQGASFGYYDSGISYLYIMEDAQHNVVTYKGTSTQLPRGDCEGVQLTLSATVKDHGVYKDVKQTVIQRPKRLDTNSP